MNLKQLKAFIPTSCWKYCTFYFNTRIRRLHYQLQHRSSTNTVRKYNICYKLRLGFQTPQHQTKEWLHSRIQSIMETWKHRDAFISPDFIPGGRQNCIETMTFKKGANLDVFLYWSDCLINIYFITTDYSRTRLCQAGQRDILSKHLHHIYFCCIQWQLWHLCLSPGFYFLHG